MQYLRWTGIYLSVAKHSQHKIKKNMLIKTSDSSKGGWAVVKEYKKE